MKYLSMFSGIEAATAAWHPLGWEPLGFAEIDPFASAVLAHHYPDIPNFGNVAEANFDELKPDLIVFGSPCQSFSIAGKRLGMDDPRGNLAIIALGVVKRLRPKWFLFENVPGLLSSGGGRDFGQFLATVGECGYQCAWRTLDAQYFGVAQRRRRVFVVGYLGDWRPAAAVLFERHSLPGHPAPSREKGKGTAADIAPSLTASGRGVERTGESRRQDPVIPVMSSGQANAEIADNLSPALNCNRDGAPIAFAQNQRNEVRELAVAGALAAEPGVKQQTYLAQPYSIMPMNSGKDYKARETEVAQPVMAGGPVGGNQGGDYIAQGVAIRGRDGGAQIETQDELANCVRTNTGGGSMGMVHHQMDVRRLTPVECCRLQQFPDDYLDLKYADADEAHAAQILHTLWREIGAKGIAAKEANFPQDGESDLCEKHRIAAALFTPEILLTGVYVGWVQWGQAWRSAERQNQQNVGAKGWSEGFLRGLRSAGEAGRTPYRRESFEQCARELGYPLSELPLEAAQAREAVRDSGVWQEAQAQWPLRYAFATEKEREKGRPLTPDGPRYKALGNSMAVPVMRWIGERIEMVDAIIERKGGG